MHAKDKKRKKYKSDLSLFLYRIKFHTRYRSEKTETNITSSLKRTFSPSLLCLDAG